MSSHADPWITHGQILGKHQRKEKTDAAGSVQVAVMPLCKLMMLLCKSMMPLCTSGLEHEAGDKTSAGT